MLWYLQSSTWTPGTGASVSFLEKSSTIAQSSWASQSCVLAANVQHSPLTQALPAGLGIYVDSQFKPLPFGHGYWLATAVNSSPDQSQRPGFPGAGSASHNTTFTNSPKQYNLATHGCPGEFDKILSASSQMLQKCSRKPTKPALPILWFPLKNALHPPFFQRRINGENRTITAIITRKLFNWVSHVIGLGDSLPSWVLWFLSQLF